MPRGSSARGSSPSSSSGVLLGALGVGARRPPRPRARPSAVFSAAQIDAGRDLLLDAAAPGLGLLAVSLARRAPARPDPAGCRGWSRRLPGPWWVRALLGTAGAARARRAGHAAVRRCRRGSNALRLRPDATSARAAGSATRASRCWSRGSSPASWCSRARSPPAGRRGAGRCGPAWRGCAADRARVVRLPGGGRAAVQPLHPAAGTASCARRSSRSREKEHVPIDDVLVADASRRTTTLNAYVSGFGSTRRVVLYDNLVDDVPERETLVGRGARARPRPAPRRPHRHRARRRRGRSSAAGCSAWLLDPAPAAATGPASSDAGPAGGGRAAAGPGGRRLAAGQPGAEHDQPGDRGARRPGGAAATGDYAAFERMQEQLAAAVAQRPDPPWLSQFWFGSHPTALQRIGMARAARGRRPLNATTPGPSAGRAGLGHRHWFSAGLLVSRSPSTSRWRAAAELAAGLAERFLMTPPKRKTMATIRAAMPATSRPYSTAEAPSWSRR